MRCGLWWIRHGGFERIEEMKRTIFGTGIFILVMASSASAQLIEMRQTIFGMDWAVCARAVSVAVSDIDGVESVDVSLNGGLAVIVFSQNNQAPVAEIRRAIKDNGFSPKSAEVRMAGIVERDQNRLYLRMVDGNGRFRLEAHPEGAGLSFDDFLSRAVVVEGEIPESGRGDADPLTLRVRVIRQAAQP
jgi:copper chaperone CopZ